MPRQRFHYLAALVLALLLPQTSSAQCGDNTPAVPVPECRDGLTGVEVVCSDPLAVRLWSESLRPGLPGQVLPNPRDSTDWRAFTIPGCLTDHELFMSLDIEDDHLYVAYNAGLQVWNVAGPINGENPKRINAAPEDPSCAGLVRDGWDGDLLTFPPFGESDFLIDDVDAVDSTGDGQEVLVALSGRDAVGLSVWRHDLPGRILTQHYQDPATSTLQVAAAELGGTAYAFAAGRLGVFVYDLSAARALASPCLDSAGTVCPGVFLGELGDMASGGYLDLIERNGKTYVAASDGDPLPARPLGLEIWEIADPASPSTAALRFSGLGTDTRGPALFEHRDGYYLAVIARDDADRDLEIYRVDHCLDADGCASLGAPVWEAALDPWSAPAEFLTWSQRDGTPFLYYGIQALNLGGTKHERLFDLTALGCTDEIVEITEDGGTYTDACSGNTVDYWGDYYATNGHGLGNLAPRVGKFNGPYFYRAAFGILDVHVWNPPVDGALIFADDFETGSTCRWSHARP